MAKKKVTPKEKTPATTDQPLMMKEIERVRVKLRIIGTTPLIQHKWSEKAKEMIREKHSGRKTRDRAPRDPEKEAEDATYRTRDGDYGVPAMAIKTALLTAAHKDLGVPRSLVQKAIHIEVEDMDLILPLDCEEPEIREDPVRVGQGSADLRYRPCFHDWAVDMEWTVDTSLLRVEDLVNLMNRAGFGVGLCEWRPEKGGEYGRFEVDRLTPITQKVIYD